MKPIKLILALCVVTLCGGCMTYRSVIRSTEFGDFELPKDVSWESLTFTKEDYNPLTQQPIRSTVEIKGLKASMNPAVIDAETARILALIDAGTKIGATAAAAAAK